MQRAGVGKLDAELRFLIAEGMKVNGFATREIQQASLEETDGGLRRVGVMQVRDKTTVKHVQLTVAVEQTDGTAQRSVDVQNYRLRSTCVTSRTAPCAALVVIAA
jgi:hypothetical protein